MGMRGIANLCQIHLNRFNLASILRKKVFYFLVKVLILFFCFLFNAYFILCISIFAFLYEHFLIFVIYPFMLIYIFAFTCFLNEILMTVVARN